MYLSWFSFVITIMIRIQKVRTKQMQSSTGCTSYSPLHVFMRITHSLMHITNINKHYDVNQTHLVLIQWCSCFGHLNGCWLSSPAVFGLFALSFFNFGKGSVMYWPNSTSTIWSLSDVANNWFGFCSLSNWLVCFSHLQEKDFLCEQLGVLPPTDSNMVRCMTESICCVTYCVDWLIIWSKSWKITRCLLRALVSLSSILLFVNYLNEISHCEAYDCHTSNIHKSNKCI